MIKWQRRLTRNGLVCQAKSSSYEAGQFCRSISELVAYVKGGKIMTVFSGVYLWLWVEGGGQPLDTHFEGSGKRFELLK